MRVVQNMSLPNTDFYFLRHGQTDWNLRHIAMGQKDIPLNQNGIEQAHRAADILESIPFETIVSSPLKRAHETARIIAAKRQKKVILRDDLKEANWGAKEGQPKKDMSWITKWRTVEHPEDGIESTVLNESGESYSHFRHRVLTALKTVLTLPTPVLIVSHGGVYWPIQEYLSLPFADLTNATPIFHRAPTHETQKWQTETLETESHIEYEFE